MYIEFMVESSVSLRKGKLSDRNSSARETLDVLWGVKTVPSLVSSPNMTGIFVNLPAPKREKV